MNKVMDKFNEYVNRKTQEENEFRARISRQESLASNLVRNNSELMGRSDLDNRLDIWNNESDGTFKGFPRYMQDEVYCALNNFRLEQLNKSANIPLDTNENRILHTSIVFVNYLLGLIPRRELPESGYTPFIGLSRMEVNDKILDETKEFYDDGLKKLGFFYRHSADGRKEAAWYSQDKMREKYLRGKK